MAATRHGIDKQLFNTLDYREIEILLKTKLKSEEEHINNNIITGAKTALKVVQYYAGSRKANDLNLVDYNINLDLHTSSDELRLYESQYNLLKEHGINPIKFAQRKEQEVLKQCQTT